MRFLRLLSIKNYSNFAGGSSGQKTIAHLKPIQSHCGFHDSENDNVQRTLKFISAGA